MWQIVVFGIVTDVIDEYVHIGKSIVILCFITFSNVICEIIGDEYLHEPIIAYVLHHI